MLEISQNPTEAHEPERAPTLLLTPGNKSATIKAFNSFH
jgi:hypothetical protein